MMETAKVGEVDVVICPAARVDVPLLAQSFDVKKADGSLFKIADTLSSVMERLNELIRNRDGFFGTIRRTLFEWEHGGTGHTRKNVIRISDGERRWHSQVLHCE